MPVARTLAEALRSIRHSRVDILVADIDLPDGSGIDAIRALRSAHPDGQAIVMSVLNEGPVVLQAIRAGATGYVIKDDGSLGVLAALEMVCDGKSPMSASIDSTSIAGMRARPRAAAMR